jgi:hypothetical protein
MIDRQKLETVLGRRFANSTREQIAAAANAIMGLGDEWVEVSTYDDFGCTFSTRGTGHCALAREADAGTEFRVLRRRNG